MPNFAYWFEGGDVLHRSTSCPVLRRSLGRLVRGRQPGPRLLAVDMDDPQVDYPPEGLGNCSECAGRIEREADGPQALDPLGEIASVVAKWRAHRLEAFHAMADIADILKGVERDRCEEQFPLDETGRRHGQSDDPSAVGTYRSRRRPRV